MNQRPARNHPPAIPFVVLGTLPLGERDTLLRIVEPRAGTLSIVLRNARTPLKGKSSWRTLDLFDRASGSLTIRPARIPTLNSFDRLPSFASLRTDLTKFGAASALAESALLLFGEQSEADSQLYDQVIHYLSAIDTASSPRDTLKELTRGLVNLLLLSGFGAPHGEDGGSVWTGASPACIKTLTPTPRMLRQAIAAIERSTQKELRTSSTISRILATLSLRE